MSAGHWVGLGWIDEGAWRPGDGNELQSRQKSKVNFRCVCTVQSAPQLAHSLTRSPSHSLSRSLTLSLSHLLARSLAQLNSTPLMTTYQPHNVCFLPRGSHCTLPIGHKTEKLRPSLLDAARVQSPVLVKSMSKKRLGVLTTLQATERARLL